MISDVTLRVVDDPPDRPEWLRETIRLVTGRTAYERAELMRRVAAATDSQLAAGSDDEWGPGQVATHVLIVDRGSTLLALRLARGEPPGATGQPRPDASGVSRERIAELAAKAEAAVARLVAEFPTEPDISAIARHPYFGDLNCFGWLLMLPNHYRAHLEALDRGRPSAL